MIYSNYYEQSDLPFLTSLSTIMDRLVYRNEQASHNQIVILPLWTNRLTIIRLLFYQYGQVDLPQKTGRSTILDRLIYDYEHVDLQFWTG